MKKNILIYMTTLLALAITPAFNVQAQEFTEEQYETGAIVVSATRTDQLIEDVPAAIEVITAEDIQRMGATSLKETLSSSASISGGFSVRGLSTAYSVILINGRRPATFEAKHDGINFLMNTIGLHNIERIEIIRGQASAMYGSNALSGVMNIITKKSSEEGGVIGVVGGNTDLTTYGSYDFGRVGNYDGIFDFRILKGISLREESLTHSGWSGSDEGTEFNVNLDAGYHFNENNELRFFFGHLLEDNQVRSKDENGIREKSTWDRRTYSAALEYNGKTEKHAFKISPYFTQAIARTNSEYTITDFGLDTQDTLMIGDWNILTYGVELYTSSINHASILSGDDSLEQYSFFIQNEIFLFDEKLILLPSVRYDYYDPFGGSFVPRFGTTYHFTDNQRIKASIGTAYNAPTLHSLYGQQTYDRGVSYGNPDLEPEESFAWEVRYEGEYKNIRGSLGYFNSDIDNKFSTERFNEDPTDPSNFYDTKRINIDGITRVQGVEAELAFDFLKYFTLSAGWTWLDHEILDLGVRDGGYSEQVYALGLDFYKPEWDLSARAWGKYSLDYTGYDDGLNDGKSFDDYGNPYVYDFFTVNVATTKTWMDKYTLTASVYNLLNNKRDTTNNGNHDPLEFHVGFQVKF